MNLKTIFICLFLLNACSISKPCRDGGDISWNPPIKGDLRCRQVKDKKGKMINDGPFTQYYKNEYLALEGQFKDGKKDGLWLHYSDKGQLIAIKYFERGVELPPPAELHKKIELLMIQKVGVDRSK